MERTGAEWIVESLKAEGVTHIFGVIGSALLEFLDAVQRDGQIRYIHTVHEQAAACMADGWARVTGQPGVCAGTVGPGATNLVSGIAQAYQESSPVVVLCGEVSTKFMGKGFCNFHEIDQVGLYSAITKRSLHIMRADRTPELIQTAFRTATSGRQGPVYVGLPRDLQRQRVAAAPPPRPVERHRPQGRPRGDRSLVAAAARLLAAAERPVALVGGGVRWSGAEAAMQALAEHLAVPVTTSKQVKGLFPEDHPLGACHVQSEGHPIGRETVQQADVLLAVGCTLSELTTARYTDKVIRPGTRILHVDIDPLEIGKNFDIEVGIAGDARAVLEDLLAALGEQGVAPRESTPWSEDVRARKESFWAAQQQEAAALRGAPVQRLAAFQAIRPLVARDAIVTGESGNTHEWWLYGWQATAPTLSPGDFSIMGSGYLMALAAKLAHPQKQVISFLGDGAFMMVMNELPTAITHNLPVVAVVFHNGIYGSIRAKQWSHYSGRYIGSDLPIPNLAAVAQSLGAYAERVERNEDIGPAMARCLASGRPAVLELMTDNTVERLEPVPRTVEDALHL